MGSNDTLFKELFLRRPKQFHSYLILSLSTSQSTSGQMETGKPIQLIGGAKNFLPGCTTLGKQDSNLNYDERFLVLLHGHSSKTVQCWFELMAQLGQNP